jgi:hypothetical protein
MLLTVEPVSLERKEGDCWIESVSSAAKLQSK